MSNLFRILLNYPKTVISTTIFFTLLFLWNIPNLRFDPSLKGMIPTDNPIVKTMDKVDDLFCGTEIIIIGVESDSLLWEKTLLKFEALHDSLEMIDQITSVISLYSAPNIISTEDGFEVEDILEYYPTSEDEVEKLQNKIRDNDLVYQNLISADFKAMAFMAQVEGSLMYDEHILKNAVE
ncbi:MAG: hypothetical protein HQ562_01530, partial [Candidatus Marinimicrobia bacterium]|nr:hypothetical protein [Candidatus Neomarinimicrobiota bacterium]